MENREHNIDYILDHLNQPETLSDADFEEWLEDSGHRQLFEEIRNYREAFMRWSYDENIDSEWERFKQLFQHTEIKAAGHSVVKKVLWRWWSAAAVIIVMIGSGIWTYYSGMESDILENIADLTGKRSAELVLADGRCINLENNPVELREGSRVLISNDTGSLLAYHCDSIHSPATTSRETAYNTIRVPVGADYVVCLMDGTKVRLNCDTRFRFPVEFAKNERRVYLDGEAFFEVSKSKEWPFIVVTDKMKVQVTGTSFNVKSYHSDDIVYTTLVNGSVEVVTDGLSTLPVHLEPSQQCNLNKRTGNVEVKTVDVRLYTDWTEGLFVFRDQRLEDILNTLSRWYSVEVFYSSNAARDLRLSASLGRYEHIDSLLEIIRATGKVEVERKNNTIVVSLK